MSLAPAADPLTGVPTRPSEAAAAEGNTFFELAYLKKNLSFIAEAKDKDTELLLL